MLFQGHRTLWKHPHRIPIAIFVSLLIHCGTARSQSFILQQQYQALDPWWFPTFLMEDDEHWWTMEVFSWIWGKSPDEPWPQMTFVRPPRDHRPRQCECSALAKNTLLSYSGAGGKSCTMAAYSFLWYEIIFFPTFWRFRLELLKFGFKNFKLLSSFYGFHVANTAEQYIIVYHNMSQLRKSYPVFKTHAERETYSKRTNTLIQLLDL